VIVGNTNQYAEVEWPAVLAHHLHFRNRATRVWCGEEACDLHLVTPGRRNEAASLMRNKLKDARTPGVRYQVSVGEYVNGLRDCADLRRLSKDALYGVNHIAPRGTQVRPGVWVGADARIDRGARIVAPAFIGALTRVREGAVITRDSVIEHHTVVDCGSVVEDAWLQPYTAVGVGLDVAHVVINGDRLFDLARNIGLQIGDPKLLRGLQESAAVRTMQAAAALVSYLPALVLHSSHKKRVARDGTRNFGVLPGTESQRGEDVAKLAPGLAVLRRYGNE
jgi:hypothetical protein